MMWVAAAAGFVAVLAAAGWTLHRWARGFDRHVDEALALANARSRHPVSRGRCRCGRYLMSADWTESHKPGEPMIHTLDTCQPRREML